MIRVNFSIPKADALGLTNFTKVIHKILEEASKVAGDDYAKTVQTWRRKPVIYRAYDVDGQRGHLVISYDSDVYFWVNLGTGTWGPKGRPYPIVPRRPGGFLRFQAGYRAKTTPGQMQSQAGGPYGPYVFRRAVMHPGIKPRGFTGLIEQDVEGKLEGIFDQAITDWWNNPNG